jgi:hypothetical protein
MAEAAGAELREHRESRYRKVRDREPLETLPDGLHIVRAMKHEAVDLSGLTRAELIARTDKRSGSKFTAAWSLLDYVDWIRTVVTVLRWGPTTGRAKHTFRLAEVVGVCKGEAVRTIEVVFDGQNLHAYPVEDK